MSNKVAILISGLLASLSFPTVLFGWHVPNLGFLAWFGLAPLLLVIFEATPRKAFLYGWLTAVLFYFISYYWIYVALHDYGGLSAIASGSTLLLLAISMALYIGVAVGLARWLVLKTGGELLIFLPAFWTLLEWARNYTPFGGFPWSNLAMSQSNYAPLIQIADITSVYGVIFLLVWFNVWVAEVILKWRGRTVPLFKQKTIVTVLLFVVVLGYGFFRINQYQKLGRKSPHLKVALLQPNIPQEEKWEPAFFVKHKTVFQEMIRPLQDHVDLIVWPETSWFETPLLETKWIHPQKYFVTPKGERTPYSLIGLSFLAFKKNEERYYNSAALFDAQGNLLGHYHKSHLVPFGEYIPLKNLFFFLKPVAAIGDFERGFDWTPLAMGDVEMAPLICFEDIFPELSRKMARNGANLLVNITNDAWYGRSSAAYQHLALAQFRSVETRRAMVRATNTGVSAVIDPTGKVVTQTPLFEQSVIIHQIPLLKRQTGYTRLGDWFVVACFILVIVALVQGAKSCPKN